MSTQEEKRQCIVDLLCAGAAIRHIAETVRASVSTVYNVKNQMLDMEDIKRKRQRSGINKKWEDAFLRSLQVKISKDSTTSLRKLSIDIKVDCKTTRTAVHTDLQLEVIHEDR